VSPRGTGAALLGDPVAAMLRGALVGAVAASAPVVVVAAALDGAGTGLTALAGAAALAVFSATTLVVMGAARRLEPVATLALALGLYTTKASLVLLALGAGAWPAEGLRWAGAAAVAGVLGWTVGLVLAFGRLRLPVFDPPEPVLPGRPGRR
jgi:hypothetical protein